MLSLIFALLIVTASAYIIVNYKRVMPTVEQFYSRFGRAGRPLMVTSGLLFIAVMLASLYIVIEWARNPEDHVTYQQVAENLLSKTEMVADQAGELVERGIADVEDLVEGKSPASDKSTNGLMDFNAGIRQFDLNSTSFQDMYTPKLVSSDGKCHPSLKGYCPDTTHSGMLRDHEYLHTCGKVEVSPPMNVHPGLQSWM